MKHLDRLEYRFIPAANQYTLYPQHTQYHKASERIIPIGPISYGHLPSDSHSLLHTYHASY